MHVSISINTYDGTVCVKHGDAVQFMRLGVMRDIQAVKDAISQMADLISCQQYMTESRPAREPEYA